MAKLLASDIEYKETNVDNIFEDLTFMSDGELNKLTKTFKCLNKFGLPDSVFLESGKFAKFDELLPDLKKNGHRLLIFSQFIFILDIMEEYMRIRNYSFLRFDGSTRVYERYALVYIFFQLVYVYLSWFLIGAKILLKNCIEHEFITSSKVKGAVILFLLFPVIYL